MVKLDPGRGELYDQRPRGRNARSDSGSVPDPCTTTGNLPASRAEDECVSLFQQANLWIKSFTRQQLLEEMQDLDCLGADAL